MIVGLKNTYFVKNSEPNKLYKIEYNDGNNYKSVTRLAGSYSEIPKPFFKKDFIAGLAIIFVLNIFSNYQTFNEYVTAFIIMLWFGMYVSSVQAGKREFLTGDYHKPSVYNHINVYEIIKPENYSDDDWKNLLKKTYKLKYSDKENNDYMFLRVNRNKIKMLNRLDKRIVPTSVFVKNNSVDVLPKSKFKPAHFIVTNGITIVDAKTGKVMFGHNPNPKMKVSEQDTNNILTEFYNDKEIVHAFKNVKDNYDNLKDRSKHKFNDSVKIFTEGYTTYKNVVEDSYVNDELYNTAVVEFDKLKAIVSDNFIQLSEEVNDKMLLSMQYNNDVLSKKYTVSTLLKD